MNLRYFNGLAEMARYGYPYGLNNAKHVSNVVKYLVIFCEILDLKLHINVDKCAVL